MGPLLPLFNGKIEEHIVRRQNRAMQGSKEQVQKNNYSFINDLYFIDELENKVDDI